VLGSVHAFATDPTRGVFILMLLAFFIGGSLLLYAWRAPSLAQSGGFHVLSRESFLLANNMLLVASATLILIGTLYPLFLDALSLGKISVGPPYFDTVFLIPGLPLVILMGLGMHAAWKRAAWPQLQRKLRWTALGALVLGIAIPLFVYGRFGLLLALGIAAGLWVMAASVVEPGRWLLRRKTLRGYPRSMLGMSIAHFGVGMFVLGVTVTSAFSIERDIAMGVGDVEEIAGYNFEFKGTRNVEGPNFNAVEAEVLITRDGGEVVTLHPQKRVYRVQRNPMTEAAIQDRISRDLFVALGDPLGANRWSVRMQYKPLIRLIWLGCLIMAVGGLVAASDRRYRVKAREAAAEAAAGKAAAT
jgi:cytochrome c-type biogenesis protein CcmF